MKGERTGGDKPRESVVCRGLVCLKSRFSAAKILYDLRLDLRFVCYNGCELNNIRFLFAMNKPHRATGAPRGRPPSLPFDLGDQILEALERRMDPATRTVRPNWKGLARELHVSRSTISREVASLKRSGFFESIAVPVRPGSKISYVLYKLNTRPTRSEPSSCPRPSSLRSQNSLH